MSFTEAHPEGSLASEVDETVSPKIDANILQVSRFGRVTYAVARRACRSLILGLSSSCGLGLTSAAASETVSLEPDRNDVQEEPTLTPVNLQSAPAYPPLAVAAKDLSTRMNFVLGTPRRYGVRFDRSTRTLEVRITPATSAEFKAAAFYDGRIVHRVVTNERNNEVFLEVQLRNTSLEWMVTHQEQPWRLIIDIWGHPTQTASRGTPWSWDGFYDSRMSAATQAGETASGPVLPAIGARAVAKDDALAGPQAALDLPGEAPAAPRAKEAPPEEKPASSVTDTAAAGDNLLGRFLAIQKQPTTQTGASLAQAARDAYLQGDSVTSLRLYRRFASLNQREFSGDPEAIWLAGESALAQGQNDSARDYFSTLVSTNRASTYGYYGDLRLLDLDFAAETAGGPRTEPEDRIVEGYRKLIDSQGATTLVKGLAALRIARRDPQLAAGDAGASLVPNFDACARETALREDVRRECAYNAFAYRMARADMLSGQGLIKDYEKTWKGDPRIAEQRNSLIQKVTKTIESVVSPEDYARWQAFETKTESAYLKGTENRPELLARRAQSWQRSGNKARALGLYLRAAELETDPDKLIPLLSRAGNLAAKQGETSKANAALTRIQGIPSRKEKGLPAEEYALVKEIALPPTSNRIALELVLDDVAKGFHAENDIRTIITLAERLDGARDADVLFQKLLAIPSRSAAEAELKEDSLMNYAEVLRNQGRLVKSADTFLAVANLDNGKSRAEAAYKAGVIYFRAGLLEKATSSWNIAANDLANSKYSALASERLNRIR